MDSSVLAGFLVSTLLVLMTPGPVMAIVAHNTLRHGTTSGLLTAVGVGLGRFCLLGMMLAGLTVSAGLVLSGLLRWLSLLGACYLVWLATNALRSRRQPTRSSIVPRSRRPIVDGLAIAFGNPVALLFYAAFFPQFIASDRPIVEQVVALSAVYLCVALAFDFVSVITVARVHGHVSWIRLASLAELGSAALYLSIAALTVLRFVEASSWPASR